MKSVIAKNVKKIINQKCLVQSGIAKKAGYDYKSFNNMLNDRKIITDDDVIRIANVLEVTPNVLFGINDKDNNNQAS